MNKETFDFSEALKRNMEEKQYGHRTIVSAIVVVLRFSITYQES